MDGLPDLVWRRSLGRRRGWIMQDQHYRLLYHTTWATKMRQPLLDECLRPAVHKYLHDKVIEYGEIGRAHV